MARALIAIVSLGLTIYALADCIQTEDRIVRGIPRWAWIILIVLIPWAGPLTWLLVGKDRSGGSSRGGWGGPGGGDGGPGGRGWGDGPGGPGMGRSGRAPRRSGPLAPDEDPEFLRKLDEDIRREKRAREREERARQNQDPEDPEDSERPGDGPERKGGAGA